MSAHSTLTISRSRAKAYIIEKLLGEISDSDLERLIDILLREKLYNVRISGNDIRTEDDYKL